MESERYTKPEQCARAALEIYLNDPSAEIERVRDDELPSLETLLKAEGLDYPPNPWTVKGQPERPIESSQSRRRTVLKNFLREKLNEGFSLTEIIQHSAQFPEIAAELREIGKELR